MAIVESGIVGDLIVVEIFLLQGHLPCPRPPSMLYPGKGSTFARNFEFRDYQNDGYDDATPEPHRASL